MAEDKSRSPSPTRSFLNNYNIETIRTRKKSSIGSDHDSFESLPSVAGAVSAAGGGSSAGAAGDRSRDLKIQSNLKNGGGSRLRMYIKDMPDFVIESPDVKISGQKTKQMF
jgi:hypothetical protein